jgi:hypothetical protein
MRALYGFQVFEDIMNIKLTEQYIEDLGRPIIENILDAHAKSNYKQVTLHFTDEMKSGLSIEIFEESIINDQHGEIASITYLGCLDKCNSFQLLWKVKYEKDAVDVLWQMYLADLNENTQVVGLVFG